MIDLATQELASLGVLNTLSAEEQAAFDAEWESNPEFRALVNELRETIANLATMIPPVAPSPGVKKALMEAIQPPAASVFAPARTRRTDFLPWALAACFALTSATLWFSRNQTQNQLVALRNEANLAGMELRLLKGTPEVPATSLALVAWDEKNQRGVIQLDKVPAAGPGKDYQLWVVDPAYKNPVDGGIIRTGSVAREFRPGAKVSHAVNFVITLEKTGGVPKAEGPAVLAGEKL